MFAMWGISAVHFFQESSAKIDRLQNRQGLKWWGEFFLEKNYLHMNEFKSNKSEFSFLS